MKKYFYTDGVDKFGPFTLEELKEKNISRETQVWYKELEDWQTAGSVSELNEIFFLSPPPLIKPNSNNKENINSGKTTNWYLKVLRQYADFNGRARRKEYWMFVLFNMIFAIAAMILDNVLGIAIKGVGYGPVYGLYTLAVLIPGLAVSVRRLHDVGKSGWMILIALIPLIGTIWLLVLIVTDSDSGENKYGTNPKEIKDGKFISSESTGDTVILLVVIWMFVSRLFWTLIPKFIDRYYSEEWFKPVNALMTLIWAIIPIGLAFAIKDKSKQIVLFVLGGIYLIYGLYETVKQFIE